MPNQFSVFSCWQPVAAPICKLSQMVLTSKEHWTRWLNSSRTTLARPNLLVKNARHPQPKNYAVKAWGYPKGSLSAACCGCKMAPEMFTGQKLKLPILSAKGGDFAQPCAYPDDSGSPLKSGRRRNWDGARLTFLMLTCCFWKTPN